MLILRLAPEWRWIEVAAAAYLPVLRDSGPVRPAARHELLLTQAVLQGEQQGRELTGWASVASREAGGQKGLCASAQGRRCGANRAFNGWWATAAPDRYGKTCITARNDGVGRLLSVTSEPGGSNARMLKCWAEIMKDRHTTR
jgi:hypothetical protein